MAVVNFTEYVSDNATHDLEASVRYAPLIHPTKITELNCQINNVE
jgi:hypothetical protein